MQNGSEKRCNYFAYGSNTEPQDFNLKTRRVLPEHFQIGLLCDRRLAFTYRSQSRDGGVLDVVPCQGSLVEGVVYSVNEEEMEAIRQKEGSPYIERQEWVYLSSGERIWAHFFEVRQHLRHDYVEPSRRYLGIVLKGYRRCGIRRDLLRAAARNSIAEASIDPRLFTYGTLMTGQCRHDILRANTEAEYWQAEIFGTLHSLGDYPAITISGEFPRILVQGELHRLKVRPNLFDTLDQIEGADQR